MKKTEIRFVALILAALMTLSFAVSCVGPDDGPGDETVSGSEGFDLDLTSLENALKLYSDGSLEGIKDRTFRILSPSPGQHFYYNAGSEENEIFYDEPSDELLPNAIYRRNRKLEDALGITIEPVWGGDVNNVSNIVTLNDAAGDHEFDVVLNRMDYEMTMAANGQLLSFYDVPTLDVRNVWWDQNIVDSFTIYGDRLFVLTGDINFYDDYSTQLILFNKNMCTELGFDYPYDAVRNGTWTMDMMTEMASVAKAEVNGDDVMTPGRDRFGLGEGIDCIIGYIYSQGLSMSKVSDGGDGAPEVVWPTDESVAAVERLYNVFTADYVAINITENNGYFKKNLILFYSTLLGSLFMMRDMETDYGVLPIPMGVPGLDHYRAYMSNGWSTSFAMPKTTSDKDMYDNGIILECMAAASRDYISPVLYERLLESKYIRDPESREMLEYVSESKVYDWAGDLAWAEPMRKVYRSVLDNGPASFKRGLDKIKKPLQSALDDFCLNLKDGGRR